MEIARDHIGNADRFIEQLKERMQRLADNALIGRERPARPRKFAAFRMVSIWCYIDLPRRGWKLPAWFTVDAISVKLKYHPPESWCSPLGDDGHSRCVAPIMRSTFGGTLWYLFGDRFLAGGVLLALAPGAYVMAIAGLRLCGRLLSWRGVGCTVPMYARHFE